MDRGIALKARQKRFGLKDREVASAGVSIDVVRKLGKVNMTVDALDSLERAIESARLSKIKVLQSAG